MNNDESIKGTFDAPKGPSLKQSDVGNIVLSNRVFYTCMATIGGVYIFLILAMLLADAWYVAEKTMDAASDSADPWKAMLNDNPVFVALSDPKIRYSIWLSLISCTLSAILSVIVAVPIGYLLARHQFPGKRLLDAVLDIPIVLPPLVVGLSLLILFQFPPFSFIARDVVYQIPAVILAQFSVACAFAVRTMKSTFDHIDPRCEQVAIALGSSRSQAFGMVVLPEATHGIITAFTLAWARSLGEFGPLLIFAGATRMKTEVLSTTVFLEMNVGDIEAAVSVSLIMVVAAMTVLVITRIWGSREALL
ncbi:ABC transporter permease [Planctomycetaceae bacterium]|jgi:molybdate transport system permease protein|nr:ABC transporter permease [Planctomycetaceae bacterium]MDC0273854.1 ABC transporter permease [Planctomycetaceae bacterium]MDG2390408.1 ABC transporter permease [Planctomycetaceae bacterium]